MLPERNLGRAFRGSFRLSCSEKVNADLRLKMSLSKINLGRTSSRPFRFSCLETVKCRFEAKIFLTHKEIIICISSPGQLVQTENNQMPQFVQVDRPELEIILVTQVGWPKIGNDHQYYKPWSAGPNQKYIWLALIGSNSSCQQPRLAGLNREKLSVLAVQVGWSQQGTINCISCSS